jgi:catechol 2,3-dioxygenase-like lactoylglutathione lyase family enzyme
MKISEFAFIVYPSSDRERSKRFYEGVLGLAPSMSLDIPGGFWLEYEIGPHTLAIGKEPFLRSSGDGPHLALEVDDFEQAVEHLRRHKIPFAHEPFDLPGCKAAIITDPDGNKLGIHQRKKR